ncbi:hypothetical protein T06_6773 [Trichinella sp. T6]|nr:hypothetical protein T06_6773 [Trichinella sp. T6]
MPGLKEKFPRKQQKAWDLKVGSGPEFEDNLEKFLEFAQLQAELLSPPDEFSPEASRQGKSGEATREKRARPGHIIGCSVCDLRPTSLPVLRGRPRRHMLPAIFGRRILSPNEHVPRKGRLL